MRLLLLAVLSLAAEGHVITLSTMYGSLESPNFPEPYPQQLDLVWDITVQTGFRIRLDFSHFHIEASYLCEYDQVQVEADGEVLGLFCGSVETDTESVPGIKSIWTPQNRLQLSFRTDFSDEERYTGFRAHYSAEDIDECTDRSDEDLLCDHFCHNFLGGFYCSCRHGYQLQPDNRTCSALCRDLVYMERSGILQSPDFPGPYPKSTDCRFQIQVQTGFRIRLQFEPVFDVEDHPNAACPYDFVTVLDGSKEFGPFCGNKSPGLIETGSSSVIVVFHSDDSGENQGWSLNYTSTGSVCPPPETPPNAVLTPVQSEYSFTDHVIYTCQSGYRIFKDGIQMVHFQITCLSNGSWSSSALRCQILDCGPPRKVAGAQLIYTDPKNSTVFGSKVRYQCEIQGQRQNQNRSQNQYQDQDQNQSQDKSLNQSLSEFVCGANGDWTNSEPGTRLPSCNPDCGISRLWPVLVKRVVGGQTARPGMFPWQVLVMVQDRTRVPERSWSGSGSLLSKSWILTAAHVLRSTRRDGSVVPVPSKDIQVFLGLLSWSQRSLAQLRSVELVVLHPDFQPQNFNNDIALMKLRLPANIDDITRPVCLPPLRSQDESRLPEPLSLGVVAGWGVSEATVPPPLASGPTPPASDLLRWVRLPVVTQSECRASYASRSDVYNVSDAMFCAGFARGGGDTCLGDSGGAFVTRLGPRGRGQERWAVLGVVSWAGPEACGSERVYGVYTRVDFYRDWITETMDRVQDQD